MGTKKRIIIVDDDIGMSETIKDILDELGYDVNVANDGYKAIEMIKKKFYNVVLMDIKMPGINGVETFKKIKEISSSERVIMMTAYSVEDLIKEALNEGAYGVIHKPFDINEVIELIENSRREFNNNSS